MSKAETVKCFTGMLDGKRVGLVVARSQKQAAQIVGKTLSYFRTSWCAVHFPTGWSPTPYTVYSRPSSKIAGNSDHEKAWTREQPRTVVPKPNGINLYNHHWVTVRDAGWVGVIIRNDGCGGVFRGHYDIFFGEVVDGNPILRDVLSDRLTQVPRPDPLPFGLSPVDGKTLSELPLGIPL